MSAKENNLWSSTATKVASFFSSRFGELRSAHLKGITSELTKPQEAAIVPLTESDEEEEIARSLFDELVDSSGVNAAHLSLDALRILSSKRPLEIERQLLDNIASTLQESVTRLNQVSPLGGGQEASDDISFEAFQQAFLSVPRLRGGRLRWAGGLGIDAVLARLLPPGDAFDGLRGLRALDEAGAERLVLNVSERLARELPILLRKGLEQLHLPMATSVLAEHANGKFATDVTLGQFATLDDFYRGTEGHLGAPNPRIYEGIEKEHCARDNALTHFTSSNYDVETYPKQEWEVVVCPQPGKHYPHTPMEKAGWGQGQKWRGRCGREVVAVDKLLQRPEVRDQVELAELIKEEVVCLRLYTGPMFVLYNAALRGLPQEDVDCLGTNKYETTIFVIASGITKLAKVTELPPSRTLYRGLNGTLALPEQFWHTLAKRRAVLSIRAGQQARAVVWALRNRLARTQGSGSSAAAMRSVTNVNGDLEFDVVVAGIPARRCSARVDAVAVMGERVRLAVTLPATRDLPAPEELEGLRTAVRSICNDAMACSEGDLEVSVEAGVRRPGFRGGVELGMLSLTASWETAIRYGRYEGGRRGTVFEVQVGRVDVGASVRFLSQYPGEDEFLMPPMSCLEVVGEPRLEVGGEVTDGQFGVCEVVVVPLRVNANLLCSTVENLIGRRKRLHRAATRNLREELTRSAEERAEALGRLLVQRRYGMMELLRGSKDDVDASCRLGGECDASFHGRHWATLYAPYLTLPSGRVYFEVEVVEAKGLLAAGFAGTKYRSGVIGDLGDDKQSWGVYSFDKTRHDGVTAKFPEVGEGWFTPGAILGLAVDLEAGTMLAAIGHTIPLNIPNDEIQHHCGSNWKIVFRSGVQPGAHVGGGLYPVLAGGWGSRARYNFGHTTMRHSPPEGGFISVFAAAKAAGIVDAAITSDADIRGSSQVEAGIQVDVSLTDARKEADRVLGKLDVDQEALLRYFGAVEERHEALAAEDYNDDTVYKNSLDEILVAKVCAERKLEAVVKLLEAGASLAFIQAIRAAPPVDFHRDAAGTLEHECQEYTWRLVLSGWFRFVENVTVPLRLPPCLIALVWRAILDAAAQRGNGDGRLTKVFLGEQSVRITDLVPTLQLRSAKLHVRECEHAILGFVHAAAASMISLDTESSAVSRESNELQPVGGSRLALTDADFQGLEFSQERILDLARVVVEGRLHGSLRRVNQLIVTTPLDGKNLRQYVKRSNTPGKADEGVTWEAEEDHYGLLKNLDPVDWAFVTAEAAKGGWKTLDISNNDLFSHGATGLSVGLGSIASLIVLDLTCNRIGPDGATAIGYALTALTELVRLNLSKNGITSAGATAIAGGLRRLTALTWLGMSENEISDAGATGLCDAVSVLKRLTYLDCKENGLGSTGGEVVAAMLQSHPLLAVVHLDKQDLKDSVWIILRALCPRITSLDIVSGVVTMIPILSQSSNLISNFSAASPDNYPDDMISQVELSGKRQLGPNGASELAKLLSMAHSLTTLELYHNGIHFDGASVLGPALAVLSSLTRLGLAFNRIGAAGALAVATGLSGLVSLRSLSLEGNDIGAAAWMQLGDAARTLTGLESLNGFSSFGSLRVGGVTSLELSGKELAAAIHGLLAANEISLTNLDASANSLSTVFQESAGSEALAAARASLKVILGLRRLTALTSLRLGDNILRAEGGKALCSSLERLANVGLLDLSRADLGPEGAIAVSDGLRFLTRLHTLGLAGNHISASCVCVVCDALSSPCALTNLDLSENHLGPDGFNQLSERLSRISRLQILRLPDNQANEIGGTALGKGLMHLAHLEVFDARSNELGANGGKAIFDGLACAASASGAVGLRIIDLRDNSLCKEGGTAIASGLAHLTALEELSLAANALGMEGGPAVVQALANKTALRQIDLGDNFLGINGGKNIGPLLSSLVGLQTLYLEGNLLTADGAAMVVAGLAGLSELRTLDLRENALGRDGGAKVGDYLSRLARLEVLDLDSNNLGPEGAAQVAMSVVHLPNLRALDMRDNALGTAGCNAVQKLLQERRLIKIDLNWNDVVTKGSEKFSPSDAETNPYARLRKRSSLRARHMTIRGCLLKLGRGKEFDSTAVWRERLCYISNGRLYYESAKKKGEPELVTELADISSVRPYADDGLPEHYMFRVEVAGGPDQAMSFSASSARERARWITALTRRISEPAALHSLGAPGPGW